jgi:hypothetical protein
VNLSRPDSKHMLVLNERQKVSERSQLQPWHVIYYSSQTNK